MISGASRWQVVLIAVACHVFLSCGTVVREKLPCLSCSCALFSNAVFMVRATVQVPTHSEGNHVASENLSD